MSREMPYTRIEKEHDRAVEMDLAIALTDQRYAMFDAAGGKSFERNPYSQYSVASKVGVSHVTICNFETGASVPCTFGQWQRWSSAVRAKFVPPRIEI